MGSKHQGRLQSQRARLHGTHDPGGTHLCVYVRIVYCTVIGNAHTRKHCHNQRPIISREHKPTTRCDAVPEVLHGGIERRERIRGHDTSRQARDPTPLWCTFSDAPCSLHLHTVLQIMITPRS